MSHMFLNEDRLPLSGVRVVDLAHLMQGPRGGASAGTRQPAHPPLASPWPGWRASGHSRPPDPTLHHPDDPKLDPRQVEPPNNPRDSGASCHIQMRESVPNTANEPHTTLTPEPGEGSRPIEKCVSVSATVVANADITRWVI